MSVAVGESLLLVSKSWSGGANYANVAVAATSAEKDPSGRPITRVDFTAAPGFSLDVSQCRLLRHAQSSHLYSPSATGRFTTTAVHLEGPSRSIVTGSLIALRSSATFALDAYTLLLNLGIFGDTHSLCPCGTARPLWDRAARFCFRCGRASGA